MAKGLFSTGYEAVKQEQERQEKSYENLKGKLFGFFLTEKNPSATILFLNNKPITFYAHTVEAFSGGGKRRYETKVCVAEAGDNCQFCDSGDKPSMKGAFLVWDATPFEYTGKDGKKQQADGSLRLYLPGIRVLGQLDRLNTKHGLTSHSWEVSRTGTRTSTTYSFDRDEPQNPWTAEEIANMLPEALRDKFKADLATAKTEEQVEAVVMKILQDQVERLLPDEVETEVPSNSSDEEVSSGDEPEEKPKAKVSSLGRRLHNAKKAETAEGAKPKARIRPAVRK